jgi:hypothetical protein
LYLQPESPRFLVSTSRFNEARDSFNRIAKVNGLGENVAAKFVFPRENYDEYLNLKSDSHSTVELRKESEQKESTNVRELFRNPILRKNIIFSAVIWCALIVNYYIVAFYLKYFPGDIF